MKKEIHFLKKVVLLQVVAKHYLNMQKKNQLDQRYFLVCIFILSGNIVKFEINLFYLACEHKLIDL